MDNFVIFIVCSSAFRALLLFVLIVSPPLPPSVPPRWIQFLDLLILVSVVQWGFFVLTP